MPDNPLWALNTVCSTPENTVPTHIRGDTEGLTDVRELSAGDLGCGTGSPATWPFMFPSRFYGKLSGVSSPNPLWYVPNHDI